MKGKTTTTLVFFHESLAIVKTPTATLQTQLILTLSKHSEIVASRNNKTSMQEYVSVLCGETANINALEDQKVKLLKVETELPQSPEWLLSISSLSPYKQNKKSPF